MVYDNKSILAVLYVMVTIDMNIGLCKKCLRLVFYNAQPYI